MLNLNVEGDSFTFVFTLFAVLLYGYIGICDGLHRRIPNQSLVILLCGAVPYLIMTRGVSDFLWDAGLGFLCLLSLFPLYAGRKMGAGDVKLIAVSAVIVGISAMGDFLTWLAIFGIGFSVFVFLPLPRLMWMGAAYLLSRPDLQNCYPTARSIPYGIPISLAAIMILLKI